MNAPPWLGIAPPPMLDRLLLRCYPRAWRERYGVEFLAVLEQRPVGLRELLDVVGAALDARLHPQLRPGPALAAGPLVQEAALRRPPRPPQPGYGAVSGPPVGAMSRRTFMRRMLGAGTALLSLEFLGGTLAFLWPQLREGLGAEFRVGRLVDIRQREPSFANGRPYAYGPARIFLVNVPAAKELAYGREVSIPNPSADQLLALWRRCPHLGCLVPQPCDSVTRYQCRCHRSTYNILGEKLKEGPAERGLDRFAVRIEADGMVVVDTSQITRGAPNRGPDALGFRDPHPWDATCSET